MNGKQRIEAALRGEWADRRPVMLHNFLMAAREAGYTQRQYRESPRAIADSFIRAVEKYDYDGIVVDVDTATTAGACGVPVDFPEDEPARYHGAVLSDLADLSALPDPKRLGDDPRVQVWLESVRRLKAYFGDGIHLRGNCDQCPYSLAGSLRGAADWMMDLMDEDRHDAARRLLDYCAEVVCEFLRLMAATGADLLSNGDSPAGPDVVSPDLYRRFAQPWERKVVAQAHALDKPYLLHICGNTNRILSDMAAIGADALELDYKTDIHLIHDTLKDRLTFAGNVDPSGVLALGTPALVEQKTRELLDVYRDSPRLIVNAGCAIPATTPPENLRALLRAARG